MANLASTYRSQDRWEEAELLEVHVLEASRTMLGENHPDTLRNMANLASTYWNQDRWEEAKLLEVQVLETSKTKLGENHPDTLRIKTNLASTYRNQSRWKEAEKLQLQVLEQSKRIFGPEHPHVLTIMANLASTYQEQGRFPEARRLKVQVLRARKRVLGPNHPDTIATIERLNLPSIIQDPSEEDISETESIATIASRTTSLSSRTTIAYSLGMSGVVETFTVFLLKNESFRMICQTALQQRRISKAQIHKDLAGLLRDFAIKLSQEKSPAQYSNVAEFVRGASSHIASRILQSHNKVNTSILEDFNIHELTETNSEAIVAEYLLAQNPSEETNPSARPIDFPESDHIHSFQERFTDPINYAERASDSDSDSDSESHSSIEDLDLNGHAIVNELQQIGDLLFNSDAFQLMEVKFFGLVNPSFGCILMEWISEQRRAQQYSTNQIRSLEIVAGELQHIVPDQISISSSDTKSIVNNFKGRFEDLTGKVWDWWPLRPYMRGLAEGEVRLQWRCVSFVSS
jgi:tetratricopeptide (TPR) repeat protein